MMHQRGLSELQGASTRRTTTQDGAGRSSRPGRGSARRPCPPTGARFWAWLLLSALVVPGAWSFLSEEQEELLVELHNHYRGLVSPSASAMLPLKWEPGLKLIAESYAAKCVWNHNPELEDTGENLFAGTGPLDLREALEKWFLEHLDYDFNNNSCDEDKMCGHYTQMVWADTHRVGCAFHLCNSMEGLDWERVSFLVCNYFPAGNYEDERPYVEGDWCSRCPENLQKCENNLCVEEEEEEEEDVTVVPPPPSASHPSILPENNESEGEASPPFAPTADPPVEPAAAVTTATAGGSISTVSEDGAEATQAPGVPTATEEEEQEQEQEEKKKEEGEGETMVEEDGKRRGEEEEEEKREEAAGNTEKKDKMDARGEIVKIMNNSAALAPSFRFLLVCLAAILALRL